MTGCSTYRKRFSTFLDGGLAPKKQAALRAHLAACAACRRELAALEGIGPMLNRMEDVPPPADLASRILAAARRCQAEEDFGHRVRPWASAIPAWPWGLKAFGAAAMLVLMLYLGQFIGARGWLPGSAGRSTAIATTAGNETEGLEWFAPGPPGSLLSGYLALAGQPDLPAESIDSPTPMR
jgi:anti-sigma factor RsiW